MRELKNVENSLMAHGINNYTHVMVCKGKPSSEGTVDLRFTEVVFNKDADTSEPLYEPLSQICKLSVAGKLTIGELKAQVVSSMEDSPNPDLYCLRNPKCEDLGEVLLDQKAVEDCLLYDDKEIYV